jgi:hypothetical protein
MQEREPMNYTSPMHHRESQRLLQEATDRGETILDIGGGVAPWHAATHIVDHLGFDLKRLTSTAWGREKPKHEWQLSDYTKLDLCAESLPFPANSFDLGFAGGVLEDLRDPVHVALEMQRVCRRVLVENPSRLAEQTQGVEHQRWTGFWHHRWMVYEDNGALVFQRKTALLNLPGCHYKLPPWRIFDPQEFMFYFCCASPFPVREIAYWSDAEEAAALRQFVAATRMPPSRLERNWQQILYRFRQQVEGKL